MDVFSTLILCVAGEAFECRIAALANVGLRRLTQRHEAAKG